MDGQVVGVLGGGQLGRMLLQAASPMSIPVISLDPEVTAPAKQVASPHLLPISSITSSDAANAPSLRHIDGAFTDAVKIREMANLVDVLTIEIEHVDVNALAAVANEFKTQGGRSGKGVKVFPAPHVIGIIQDKYAQKEYLATRNISVARYLPITVSTEPLLQANENDPRATLLKSVLLAVETLGLPLMLKSRHLAYDGRGNYLLKSRETESIQKALKALIPDSSLETGKPLGERLYAEQFEKFIKEVAVMVVQGVDGQTRTYPAVETIHRDSVCHIVYAPLRPPNTVETGTGSQQRGRGAVGLQDISTKAQKAAEEAISALGEGAVGVFGVEMFLMANGDLKLNEIAPRPHNSGHYTIEACTVSQYTAHLYAILSLPLPVIDFIPASAGMINLLGASSSASDDFMKPDGIVARAISMGAAVHLYGKKGCRAGRKMGHVTVIGASDDEVRRKIAKLADALPGDYREPYPTDTFDKEAPVGDLSARQPLVSIIMGSDSDLPVMKAAADTLRSFGIPFELSIVSAHRTPERMVEFAQTASGRGVRVIIAGAGGAAHLPGMVASETSLPVIGVPVKGSTLDGVDSLYSIVQMPRGIPVATVAINNSTNAALLAVRILASAIPSLKQKIDDHKHNLEVEVMAKIAQLEDVGWDGYVVKK